MGHKDTSALLRSTFLFLMSVVVHKVKVQHVWLVRHDVAVGFDGDAGVAVTACWGPWAGLLAAPLNQCPLGGAFPSPFCIAPIYNPFSR